MKLLRSQIINQIKVQFPSLSQNESFSRLVVSGFAAQLNPQIDEISDIKTAISEAVTNAIVHAYQNTTGKIELVGTIYQGRILYISIKDWGCGIVDIEKAMEPLFSTGLDEERAGLGFTVMESFMDSIKVRSVEGKGTTVVMVKKIRVKS
ncbi:MAG: anti-sigma F factor [Clostridiales bacterium]|nr:anti-sigma F factor [Clostridiales bacterium]